MTRVRRTLTGLLLAVVLLATAGVQAAGNGGFDVAAGFQNFDPTVHVDVLAVDCNPGFTCGTVNIEVDWDDGSAIDDHVEYYTTIGDEEFQHEYDDDGTYHVELSLDDNFGNWYKVTRDMEIDQSGL